MTLTARQGEAKNRFIREPGGWGETTHGNVIETIEHRERWAPGGDDDMPILAKEVSRARVKEAL
jgi:hypothetical protein